MHSPPSPKIRVGCGPLSASSGTKNSEKTTLILGGGVFEMFAIIFCLGLSEYNTF